MDPLDRLPLPAGDGYLDFDAGHGTFVAGIVQHVAPDAEIKVYRAISSDGIAPEIQVACEMIQAVKDGAQILNLSLGCQTQDNVPPIAIRAALDVIGELEREQGRRGPDRRGGRELRGFDALLAGRVPAGGVGRRARSRHAASRMV